MSTDNRFMVEYRVKNIYSNNEPFILRFYVEEDDLLGADNADFAYKLLYDYTHEDFTDKVIVEIVNEEQFYDWVQPIIDKNKVIVNE